MRRLGINQKEKEKKKKNPKQISIVIFTIKLVYLNYQVSRWSGDMTGWPSSIHPVETYPGQGLFT